MVASNFIVEGRIHSRLNQWIHSDGRLLSFVRELFTREKIDCSKVASNSFEMGESIIDDSCL